MRVESERMNRDEDRLKGREKDERKNRESERMRGNKLLFSVFCVPSVQRKVPNWFYYTFMNNRCATQVS